MKPTPDTRHLKPRLLGVALVFLLSQRRGRISRGGSGWLLGVALVFLLSQAGAAAADFRSSEAGVVFSTTGFEGGTEAGVGGRFLHNYTPATGFEFQAAYYPVDKSVSFLQGSFQLKVTHRIEERHRVNYFGVLGPGLILFDPESGGTSTRFGLNVGGGIEMPLRPDVAVRADLSDFVFFSDGGSFHNFDFKVALMYRW
ncbi:MAG: outer membrane beta-barrel protein [Acidobacteria bacterium]|nr:outer membrane beta-barrel protein [Acidobacteriota bacterium]